MVYPIIPDVARVQVRMQKATGLPEDVFVNTFYFKTAQGEDTEEGARSMADKLDAFYSGVHGTATASIASFMPGIISSVQYVFYDLGDQPPRYPAVPSNSQDPFIEASWLPSGSSTDMLPEEVALVMSFKSGNGPRRRGRVYLGPLKESACAPSDLQARPAPALLTSIQQAAINLIESTESGNWAQVSPTAGDFGLVNAGWVDNAFDTQRRRGARPNARTTFTGTPHNAEIP